MDKELSEIKESLIKKKAELQSRYERAESDLKRESQPLDKDFAEAAVERENDDVLKVLKQNSLKEIKQINEALDRIEKGEYTECAVCGNEIRPARLKIVPYTKLCISCAEKQA